MNKPTKLQIIMVCVVALVCLGQSTQNKTDEVYRRLQVIASQRANLANQTSREPEAISALYKQGVDLLEQMQIPEQEKQQFLFDHLNKELIEIETRETLVKMLIRELSRHKAESPRFRTVADFLNRQDAGHLDSALIAVVAAGETKGVSIFSQPEWVAVLKSQIKDPGPQQSFLTEYLLETAEREGWLPYGTTNWSQWDGMTGEEKIEIANSALAVQRNILARQYLDDKLAKQR
jgi:hypothetical protein